MRKKIPICRLAATFMMLLPSFPLTAGNTVLPKMIDAHAHYSTADAAALSPEEIVTRLNHAGVRKLVVTSSPPTLVQRLYQHAPDRFVPMLGVYGMDQDKTDWMQDPSLPRKAAAWLENGEWAGLGELHLFAKDVGNSVFQELLELADRWKWVVMIHGDAAVVERALEIAPNIRVLWAHLGTRPEPELLSCMLSKYPDRLWIDTSVRDERIAPNGELLPAWRALFERHPDRFVVAVDTFSLNRWHHYQQTVVQIRKWTSSLPPSLATRLLHDNAIVLFEAFRPQAGKPMDK